MALTSEYRIHVLETYNQLMHCLDDFKQSFFQDDGLVAWLQDLPPLAAHFNAIGSVRQRAFQIIKQLEYLDQQEPREILVCAGFMGSSPQTLEKLHQVNESKDQFKEAILQLKQVRISLKDKVLNEEFEKLLNKREQTTAHSLKRMGLARLHLKQCYRKIPILKYAPKKISWTWAHTRAIKRITMEEARSRLLKKKQDEGIQRQLHLLSTLSPQEPLAVVQELAPHLRANILLPKEASPKHRLMIKGPVPIFFPASLETPSPEFNPPSEKRGKDANRLIRKDVQLDPIPFLPAIRAHRYHETP